MPPGPQPKPPGQKRHSQPPAFQVRLLPRAGRPGPAPRWPSGVIARAPRGPLKKEWEIMWAMPQAVAWDEQGLVKQVARYLHLLDCMLAEPDVRINREIDLMEEALSTPGHVVKLTAMRRALSEVVDTKLLAEVRQLEDRLGLNPAAMRSLRWEIAPAEEAEETAGPATGVSHIDAARRRRLMAGDDT